MEKERQRYERGTPNRRCNVQQSIARDEAYRLDPSPYHQGDTLVLGRLLRDATHGGERVVQFQCHHFKLS